MIRPGRHLVPASLVLERHGMKRWCAPGVDIVRFDKPKKNGEHPTMKPVGLIRRFLENSAPPGSVVLDLFGGSGSTLIACEVMGREARLIELEPKFCDVIVMRWQEMTGRRAVLEADGREFDAIRAEQMRGSA